MLPLTLKAIGPSIPEAGEAARVSAFPERICEYAVNPALVRLDDDEVTDPRYTAVHVESPAEWGTIAQALLVAGMFEAEVEEERVREASAEIDRKPDASEWLARKIPGASPRCPMGAALRTDDCPRRRGVVVLCRGPEALLSYL